MSLLNWSADFLRLWLGGLTMMLAFDFIGRLADCPRD
jgi:hypothetical protein